MSLSNIGQNLSEILFLQRPHRCISQFKNMQPYLISFFSHVSLAKIHKYFQNMFLNKLIEIHMVYLANWGLLFSCLRYLRINVTNRSSNTHVHTKTLCQCTACRHSNFDWSCAVALVLLDHR